VKLRKQKNYLGHLIKLNPNNIKAYYRLFRMNQKDFENNYLDKIKLFKDKNNLSLEDSSLINFIISKYEKSKDKKNEIKYLHNAHKNQFDSNPVHNSKLNEYHIKILINNFNKFDFLNK
jgi:hypothetical protein